MRVDPAFPQPTPSTPTSPAPAQSDLALSFGQLLEQGLALETERQERAFGFSELGVIKAASCAAASERVATPGTSSPQTAPNADEMNAAPVTEQQEASRETVTRPAGTSRAGALSPVFADVAIGLPAFGQTAEPAIPVMVQATTSKPVRRSEQADRKAPVRNPSQAAQTKRFSLVISEQDGAVQIIAGAPELSANAKDRLRKAAAMLAAEFGLTLGDFTINGALIDAPIFTGAPHGDLAG